VVRKTDLGYIIIDEQIKESRRRKTPAYSEKDEGEKKGSAAGR
jgi:hypothetical protein